MLLAQPKNTDSPIKQQHRWSKDWSVFKQSSYANSKTYSITLTPSQSIDIHIGKYGYLNHQGQALNDADYYQKDDNSYNQGNSGYQNGQVQISYYQITTTTKTIIIPIYEVDETRYLHRDNLGSIDTITDNQGNVVERMSYAAFGKRRAGNWTQNDNDYHIPILTNRGFTGHEHIDEMGLIHMNGRVYDPSLGRFLSADPYIQAPYNTQSYNRYSYVLNNPLKYVDPSGYGWLSKLWKKIKRVVKVVATIAAVAFAITTGIPYLASSIGGWLGVGIKTVNAAILGARIGFVVGGATGGWKGAIRGAIQGGISAGITHGIGHGTGSWSQLARTNSVTKALAHGLAQGSLSHISGGRFKDGFTGAVVSSVAGGYMNKGGDWSDITKRTAIAATAGGIAAELGGGKFANGARSAAFVHLFNAEGGNIKDLLTPDRIAAPSWEGKLGFASINVSPATLEVNMTNPVNPEYSVFSNTYSGTFGGIGIQAVKYSYDLTQTWTNFNYNFKSDFGPSKNSGHGIYYHGGIGFKRGRLDYQYDFEVPIIRPSY